MEESPFLSSNDPSRCLRHGAISRDMAAKMTSVDVAPSDIGHRSQSRRWRCSDHVRPSLVSSCRNALLLRCQRNGSIGSVVNGIRSTRTKSVLVDDDKPFRCVDRANIKECAMRSGKLSRILSRALKRSCAIMVGTCTCSLR